MAKAIQTRNGDVAIPSGPASDLETRDSVTGSDVAQATPSRRHEQSVVTIEDEPRVAVSAAHVPFGEICQQFGLLDAATSRGARLVDAEVSDEVCADGPGCDANALGSDLQIDPLEHLSNNRRSS